MEYFLQNKLVGLRKMSADDDFGNYMRFANDSENLLWLDGVGNFPVNEFDLKEHVAKNESMLLAIHSLDNETHVGNIQLSCINHQHRNAMLGILLGREFKGKGYAFNACALLIKHAFTILNLHRIYLVVIEGNKPAIALYEKLGFIQEGVDRDMHLCNFQYYDGIRYGMLEDEYR